MLGSSCLSSTAPFWWTQHRHCRWWCRYMSTHSGLGTLVGRQSLAGIFSNRLFSVSLGGLCVHMLWYRHSKNMFLYLVLNIQMTSGLGSAHYAQRHLDGRWTRGKTLLQTLFRCRRMDVLALVGCVQWIRKQHLQMSCMWLDYTLLG